MTARFTDHILPAGPLAARPAATAVPAGTLYPTTDDGNVYQSDGATWSVWATLSGGGAVDSVNGQTGVVVLDAADVGAVPADQVPSLDEIAAGYSIPVTISADVSHPIFIAPFALSVEAFSICTFGLAITASDTNYWTIELRRVRGLTSTTAQTDVIAKRSTKATASAGDPAGTLPYRGDWNFDGATFDSSFKVLQKGDIVAVAFLKTGAPGTIGAPGGSVRYVPA